MLPHIVISTLDFNRLDLLLDSMPSKQAPTKDALADELSRAAIVEPWAMPPRVVTMHSRVRFRLGGSREELSRTLVYPKDAGDTGDKLSVLSPVGGALLGLSEGDCIEWPHPDGRTISVEVLEVVYQPERSGDFHL